MAVYRIFPRKDTFIFTEQSTGNAGKDEIIEIGGYPKDSEFGETSRILTKFADEDIIDVVDNIIGSNNYSASYHMYLAEASELPTEYNLYAYPIYISGSIEWDNGVGKFDDIRVNTTGASWEYIQIGEVNPWQVSGSVIANVTSSWINGKQGGGTWYTSSNGESMEFSQNHTLNSSHDVDINVTAAIKQMYTGSLPNKGFIVKLEDGYEAYTSASIRLKYFGRDTNTIYPSFLEFKWDDSSYATGSLNVLSTDISTISVKNNKGKYADEGKQRFKLTVRPKYPTRTFTTSSIYLTNYALPEASYWGIKDEYTEEMIVDFDVNFTKVSCDTNGAYFDVYMGGLQPERYYRILIKTELDGSDVIVDNENIFKIVRNG